MLLIYYYFIPNQILRNTPKLYSLSLYVPLNIHSVSQLEISETSAYGNLMAFHAEDRAEYSKFISYKSQKNFSGSRSP